MTDGLHIGIKGGGAIYLGESFPDASGLVREFNSQMGGTYDFEISKYLYKHFELGLEIGTSILRGETDNPQFSAEDWHYSMSGGIDDPVEFKSKLLGQKFLISYYLRDLSKETDGSYLNPFVRVGIGHLYYKAKVQYKDPADGGIIFSKGIKGHSEASLTSAVYFAGAGIKANLSPGISIMALGTINYATYDFLDAVYNYSASGERLGAHGYYSELKLGLIYHFGKNGGGKNKSKGKNKGSSVKGGSKNQTTRTHLPFAPRR